MSVGVDIIEIDRIRYALEKYGGKLKRKLFTETEIEYCESRVHPNQHFAARFAAKEAVSKTLRYREDFFMRWRDVEVVSEGHGAPHVRLYGEAAEKFDEQAISLSISHSKDTAVAVAILKDN